MQFDQSACDIRAGRNRAVVGGGSMVGLRAEYYGDAGGILHECDGETEQIGDG